MGRWSHCRSCGCDYVGDHDCAPTPKPSEESKMHISELAKTISELETCVEMAFKDYDFVALTAVTKEGLKITLSNCCYGHGEDYTVTIPLEEIANCTIPKWRTTHPNCVIPVVF